jgi:hypothetical protein
MGGPPAYVAWWASLRQPYAIVDYIQQSPTKNLASESGGRRCEILKVLTTVIIKPVELVRTCKEESSAAASGGERSAPCYDRSGDRMCARSTWARSADNIQKVFSSCSIVFLDFCFQITTV